jgi:2-amino-4-hydroxy-6-hydroxymethyldihydropteridine diphosphokinase
MNHSVIISLASNRFQKKNLSKARRCLEEILSNIQYTSEQWTEPFNAARRDVYLNQIVRGTTTLDEDALNLHLKQTEISFGRNDAKRQLGIVPIDLDILEFDGQKRHLRDWQRPYIQQIISEFD